MLFVASNGVEVLLCGPKGDEPPVYERLDLGQVERLCREALAQSDRHAAERYLRDALPALESPLPGLRNEGLLSTHELQVGAKRFREWKDASERSTRLLDLEGDRLLSGLGFKVQPIDKVVSLLRAGPNDQAVAVAVLLRQGESPDIQNDRCNGLSPISYALSVADRERAPYVVVTQGRRVRLYPARMGVGVGRRGSTETFIEAHLALLRNDDAGFLSLLLSADALRPGGTLERLLAESQRFAGELAAGLRERIYDSVVPALAEGIAAARRLRKPTIAQLAETYEMAITVLFRLLFIAYAEDKDLLPFKHSSLYRDRSLKKRATELAEMARSGTDFDDTDSLWREAEILFRAVEKGKPEWSVPEYDGGLFTSDPELSPVGAALEKIKLPNHVFGPALRDLLCLKSAEGWGPVDFRSLSVREFGTIYEGLLESELSLAEVDLARDKGGIYRPCRKGETAALKAGKVYLHDRSGARKSSGSYFTKDFAVEYLLDNALEPALEEHLGRLDGLKDDDLAAASFFDFRVADIAMGSGHFLVAAVDRVERRLSNYLAKRPLSGVSAELVRLREAARSSLGALADQVELEDTQLLRRLIAKRCIYGVDLNPIAVQLARVSIWIHTFVPGLPLSLLDHNLVVGNSLVGIARFEEVEAVADIGEGEMGTLALYRDHFTDELKGAAEPLARLAKAADATPAEVKKARKAIEDARKAVAPAAALCDIATAARMRGEKLPVALEGTDKDRAKAIRGLPGSKSHAAALRELKGLTPFHFPVAFPEVFLRSRAGFDVILGNPPWQEVTVEEHAFWARHDPGLRGLAQRERAKEIERWRRTRPDLTTVYEREVEQMEVVRLALTTGPYPGMGTGDPDLYKGFSWRFWDLVVQPAAISSSRAVNGDAAASADEVRVSPIAGDAGGWIGVVLPRSVFNAKGSTELRQALLRNAMPFRLAMLLNTGGWVFDEAEHRYTIALVALRRDAVCEHVDLLGPFPSLPRFRAGLTRPPHRLVPADILAWTDTASLPLLPAEDSFEVFQQLRRAPRLDADRTGEWRARPYAELHATFDKPLMDLRSVSRPRGFWPVMKGESFDIFEPDLGDDSYYAWIDPKKLVPALMDKRNGGRRNKKSVWHEFDGKRPEAWWRDEKTLPCFAPRIAFRDVTNRTNQRTLIAALVPPKVGLTNKAPYLAWARGDVRDQAFVLGVMSSLAFDWYCRRFIETAANFFIVNPLPVPRPARTNPDWRRVVEIAARLSAIDDRYKEWAVEVGVECGPVPVDRRHELLCKLDACVARLYGLTELQLRHIFETFHEGWGPGATADHHTLGDYDARLRRTMDHFEMAGE